MDAPLQGPERHSISVVTPVYNGEGSVAELCRRLGEVLPQIALEYEIILVNDGSRDRSWDIISELSSRFATVRGLNLMRNYGQHNALLCGIRAAKYDVIVTMDDDLQHATRRDPASWSRNWKKDSTSFMAYRRRTERAYARACFPHHAARPGTAIGREWRKTRALSSFSVRNCARHSQTITRPLFPSMCCSHGRQRVSLRHAFLFSRVIGLLELQFHNAPSSRSGHDDRLQHFPLQLASLIGLMHVTWYCGFPLCRCLLLA